MISIPSDLHDFMVKSGYDTYKKIRSLTDTESKDDPQNDPFRSMYKARKLLKELHDTVHQAQENDDANVALKVMESLLLLHLGSNYITCEERSTGEECLLKCTNILSKYSSVDLHYATISITLSANTELAILYASRNQCADRALSLLNEVEAVYNNYRDALHAPPLSIDELFYPNDERNTDEYRKAKFENIYTHALFYLAQIHKQLDNSHLSASYCLKTLERQLQTDNYDPKDWAINIAGLSQYFLIRNSFLHAKYCLCCANVIVDKLPEGMVNEHHDQSNDLRSQCKADIARCWVKYFLALLENSREKLGDSDCGVDTEKQDKVVYENENTVENADQLYRMVLDLGSDLEEVAHENITVIEQCTQVFLQCKSYINVALNFFRLDGYVTDHIELAQDTSSLYKHLIFFTRDKTQKCKLHKRRVDVLSRVLQEINPQFYLLFCRQLQFELGEICSNMVSLKIEIANSTDTKPTQHATKKINKLCVAAIKYFDDFLSTVKEAEKFDIDIERPVLLAHLYLARLHSQFVVNAENEKLNEMQKSFRDYKYIIDYVRRNPESKQRVLKEYEICEEMIEILPRSMERYLK